MEITMSVNGMKLARLLLVASLGSIASWGAYRYHKYAEFDSEFTQYMRQAVAQSNSSDPSERQQAKEYAHHAIDYLKENGMTDGRTGVLNNSPETDVGRWYKRTDELVSRLDAHVELKARADKAQLAGKPKEEIANEQKTLLVSYGYNPEESEGGPLKPMVDSDKSIKTPPGISAFPMNKQFFYWGWASVVTTLISLGTIQVLRVTRKGVTKAS